MLDWIQTHAWETWLGLALLLAVAEMLSMDLILLMLAAGALTGAVTAILGAPGWAQSGLAILVALGMLGLVRPNLLRKLHDGADLKVGHEKLVGQTGVVTEPVTFDEPGRMKIAGEVWSAAPEDPTDTFSVGDRVTVTKIMGAVAHVTRAGTPDTTN